MGAQQTLAMGTAVVLIAIAVLHVYWGVGGFWPGHDEASLVDRVMGAPPGTPVPPLWACMIVAFCLAVPAGGALILAGLIANGFPRWLVWVPAAAVWVSALVFLGRGASTYLSPWLDAVRGTAFYELDRTLYAPLCILLGLSLIVIASFSAARRASRPLSGKRESGFPSESGLKD